MVKKSIVTFLLYFLFAFSASSQTPAKANTLLWRISGNGLSKPSYLYGTMHLQDRRLFYFTDSLYCHLEKTDGYAMEIDPIEASDSIIKKMMADIDTSVKLKEFLSSEEFKTYSKKLEKKLGIPAEKITQKKLLEEQRKIYYKFKKQDDMPTAMDIYLFGIAKNQGKWVGGIEDVNDQLNLLDVWGGAVKIKDLFMPDEQVKSILEEMIKIYIEQDLDKLNSLLNESQTPGQRTLLLLNRNEKMARRIDSLARIRSTFFAIGAGHLPADSGVIDLLTKKGFNVTPVFSSKRINPDSYKYTIIDKDWPTYTEEIHKSYTVQFPGKPLEMDMKEQTGYMKMYANLLTNTFYLTGVGPLNSKTNNLDSLATEVSRNMNKNGKILSKKKITRNGMDGYEIFSESLQLSTRTNIFIHNEAMYLAITGYLQKDKLNSPEAEHFFNSFTINKEVKIPFAAINSTWKTLRNEQKGFVAKCPVTLKLTPADEDNKEFFFTVKKYSGRDLSKNLYYLVIVRDAKPGSYFHGDSLNANNIRLSLDSVAADSVKMEKRNLNGVPQYRLSGNYKENNEPFRIAYMLRENRSYTLFAIGEKSGTAEMERNAEAFIDSFELIKATPVVWNSQKDSNNIFTSWLPGTLNKTNDEQTANTNSKYDFNYLSYDESTCNSYSITAQTLNKFYWATSDSAYLNNYVRSYFLNYTDSIIEYKPVMNGNIKGAEYIIKNPQDVIVRKYRLLLNGDRLYSLYALVNLTDTGMENNKMFFEDFRVANEQITTVSIPKQKKLFEALLSSDSATVAEAKEALEAIPFTKSDLPFLHQALFTKYNDEEDYSSSTHRNIVNILEEIGDSSTVEYIKINYHEGLEDKEELRLNVLNVLASQKTKTAYATLKELIFSTPIVKGESYYLESALKDSLALTKTLYPELFELAGDTILWDLVTTVGEELLDSGLLDMSEVKPYENELYKIAAAKAPALSKFDDENGYSYGSLIHFLQKLNTTNSNTALLRFTNAKSLFIKLESAIALIQNNKVVNSNTLLSIAASNDYRISLYSRMEEIKKTNLFPAKYFNQKDFGLSEIASIAADDDEPSSIIYIGERTAMYMGKMKKFLLYKISYDYGEGEQASYLGITGPYDINSKKVHTSGDLSGIYFEEEFKSSQAEKQLKKYLNKQEEYAKENQVVK